MHQSCDFRRLCLVFIELVISGLLTVKISKALCMSNATNPERKDGDSCMNTSNSLKILLGLPIRKAALRLAETKFNRVVWNYLYRIDTLAVNLKLSLPCDINCGSSFWRHWDCWKIITHSRIHFYRANCSHTGNANSKAKVGSEGSGSDCWKNS